MDAPLASPVRQQAQPAMNWPSTQSTGFGGVPAPVPRESSTLPSTDAHLKNFTLLAEAAKRAQMAVMIRDLENVGLS